MKKEPIEIEMVGKIVVNVSGRSLAYKDGKTNSEPLKVVFNDGCELVIDLGTFYDPSENQMHVLGDSVANLMNRCSPWIRGNLDQAGK